MGEAKADAVSFQIYEQRPLEIAVAVAAHQRHLRPDVFQVQEQTGRADIAEMPDFVCAFRQRRKVVGEMIVRIGENKNPERLRRHLVILRKAKRCANTQVTLLPGLTDLLFTPVSFNNFGLSPEVVRGTQAMGFTDPTPIQLRAFPVVLAGKDLIGTAQTGTGKTAAFALPILTNLAKHGAFRCLVLEPTRELAAQVETAFRDYGRYTDLRVSLIHGGVGYGKQREEAAAGMDIVVATPGRLLDHLGQGTIELRIR